MHASTTSSENKTNLLAEWPLAVSVVTTGIFMVFSEKWFADLSNTGWFSLLFAWLFLVILAAAFAIVRHAEALAELVGEPLGTLILTLAVTGLEVMMISAVMYGGQGPVTMARDSMFAVVMLVLNGMLGLSLLLGGWKHREQSYNLQGASAFLAVIIPLAVLGLVLPNYTHTTPGPTLSSMQSIFLIVMSLVLYAVFLSIQTIRHREYFVAETAGDGHAHHHATGGIWFHAVLLFANLLPLVILSKKLAVPVNYGIEKFNAPPALGGFLVAILILSPESLAACRAALSNQLMRSVNVLLGSALATIGLTIPAVLTIGFMTQQTIVLGISPVNTVLLLLTLATSMITFSLQKTNVLMGAIHLLLFLAYVLMIFD